MYPCHIHCLPLSLVFLPLCFIHAIFPKLSDSTFMDKNLVAKPSDYQQPFGSSKTYTSEAQTVQESSVQEFPSFGQQGI